MDLSVFGLAEFFDDVSGQSFVDFSVARYGLIGTGYWIAVPVVL